MHIQTVLKQLGYPENQVKIYLAALKMGETTIVGIAEQVGMPRTTVTEIVNEMHRHGLMNYYTKRNRKYWVAENPEKLMIVWQERGAALKNILPSLQALRYEAGNGKPNVKCYVGTEEVKNIFDDIIETKHHIMALISWDDIAQFFGVDFMNFFIERRYTHFLKIRLITPKTELAMKLKRRDSKEMRQTKFLPEHIALRRVSNFIYDSKVATISLNRKEPTGIIVEDPDVVHAQTIYFESLWHHSTDQ